MLSAFAGNENWFTLDQPGEQVVVGEKTDSTKQFTNVERLFSIFNCLNYKPVKYGI